MEFITVMSDLVLANLGYIIPVMGIFTRLSVFLFLVPGIGETAIPQRVRLTAAFLITWMLVPLILPSVTITNPTVTEGFLLIAKEAFYGFIFGFSFRLMIFALQILGNIVSQAMSISQVLGEGIATEPNTTISSLLMIAGATLLVTMNLHVEAIGVFYRSYETFPLGSVPDLDNVAHMMTYKSMEIFTLGVTLALPFIIINFVYNLMLGFLNRAMPQLLVSFVGMPAITGAGLFLLSIAAVNMLVFWAKIYADMSMDLPLLPPGGAP